MKRRNRWREMNIVRRWYIFISCSLAFVWRHSNINIASSSSSQVFFCFSSSQNSVHNVDCPSVVNRTVCCTDMTVLMTRRFIVMTQRNVVEFHSLNVNSHYSQMFRIGGNKKRSTMMMNNCSWQNQRRRPSVDGAQDCIWPQLFSLAVHRSQQ